MLNREEQREKRRQYHRDVEYKVWRGGGNADLVNYDRVEDAYYDGQPSDITSKKELDQQMPRPQEEE